MIEILQHVDELRFRRAMERSPRIVQRLLREAIDDIADQVENTARANAPVGETGALKTRGIERSKTVVGTVSTAFVFGGGRAVSGYIPGGTRFAFVGSVTGFNPGDLVAQANISLNPRVKHSKWVHDGTGIYGPRKTPIVPLTAPRLVFFWNKSGRLHSRLSVRGQPAQPFLRKSYEYVNNVYTPARVGALRLAIGAVT
jgi:hypothetical protein